MHTHRWVDFYAKSLALLGLSSLAAIGALIDHWPAPANLPEVTFTEQWVVPRAQTVAEIPTLPPSPVALRPLAATRVSVQQRVSLPSVRPRWTASFRPQSAVAKVDRTEPEVVATLTLVVPGRIGIPSLPTFELSAPPEPAVAEALVETWQPMSAPATALADSDEGFFTGALKKTSSSVSASLGKARMSLIGAVRVVGGAVKKVPLPLF